MARSLRLLLAAAMSAALVAGCGGDSTRSSDRPPGAYAALISWALTTMPPAKPGPEPLVFVAARRGEHFSLDTQAAVVQELDGEVSVRFVDDRPEAVDTGAERDPVRSGGLLLTTGRLAPGERAAVSVTLYRRADLVRSFDVTLSRESGTWRVAAAKEEPAGAS